MIPIGQALQAPELCADDATVERNIKVNCALGLPQVLTFPAHTKRATVCAGGPSLTKALPAIRGFKSTVVAINKASIYLIENGIVPHYVVMCDPSEWLLYPQFAIDKRCTYLVSSKCQPGVFDLLKSCPVFIWHEFKDGPRGEWIRKHYPDPVLSLYGSTVTLRSPGLLYAMGYRRVDFYGWDGSYEDSKNHHAFDQSEEDVVCFKDLRVSVCGKEFLTREEFAREAHEVTGVLGNFRSLERRGMAEKIRFEIHGDGLIPTYWREWRKHQI